MCLSDQNQPATVDVEFLGVARSRMGRDKVSVAARTLGELLSRLGAQSPEFARTCLDRSQLKPGLIANINGREFVEDESYVLKAGDCVIILSADAGG